MSLVHNEQVKLRAAWMNALASGVILTGAVAPAIGAALGVTNITLSLALIAAAIWLIAGFTLHVVAWRYLRRLIP